jgi:hypothetical protein
MQLMGYTKDEIEAIIYKEEFTYFTYTELLEYSPSEETYYPGSNIDSDVTCKWVWGESAPSMFPYYSQERVVDLYYHRDVPRERYELPNTVTTEDDFRWILAGRLDIGVYFLIVVECPDMIKLKVIDQWFEYWATTRITYAKDWANLYAFALPDIDRSLIEASRSKWVSRNHFNDISFWFEGESKDTQRYFTSNRNGRF